MSLKKTTTNDSDKLSLASRLIGAPSPTKTKRNTADEELKHQQRLDAERSKATYPNTRKLPAAGSIEREAKLIHRAIPGETEFDRTMRIADETLNLTRRHRENFKYYDDDEKFDKANSEYNATQSD